MVNSRHGIKVNLIAALVFSIGFCDVRVMFDTVNVLTPQFYNTTSQPVQLGGWRLFTRTFHWMNIGVTGAVMNQKERTVNGYIETEAAFDKSTQETVTKLMYTGETPTSKSLGYSWVSNGESPQTRDPYEPYILLKTGSSGVPDDPVDEPPITLVQLDSLMKTPNFYNINYRYKDSLGVNGGKYSGGFLDTWLGKTQVQIPITKTTFVLSNTTLRFHPDITKGPMYWMTLAMGQEYFHVDLQWMMGFGAKESFAGVVIDATGQGNYIGTNLDGAYGAFEVEGPTGTDRAIAYPKFFPEYAQALSSAAAVSVLPFTPSQFCSEYMGAAETPINSAYVVNSFVFSITCQYSLYDLLSYAEDFCWKEVLSQCKDPYVGLGAMAPLYNLGMWGVANIAAPLHVSRYQTTIPNPLARDLFPTGNSNYRPNILTAIQALIDASSQSVTNPGSIAIWDSPITLDEVRSFFLGEGGTVNTQGKGGMLKHFYVKETATRAAIMTTVETAFSMLKGHAPSTLGTNNISFRYDWLALLRTVKGYFDCTRKRPAGGDIVIKINENSVVGGCSGDAPDYSYPYGEVTDKKMVPAEFVATIAATDNKLIKEVKFTTEYNWKWWLPGDSVSGTGGSKVYELHVDTSLYDGVAGDTVWYMVTDGSGNSIVRTTMIEGVKYPSFDSSIIEDTRGNGVGNRITVFIRRAVGDSADELSEYRNLKYSWPTQTNLISAAGNVAVNSASLVISDNTLTGGAGLGRVTFDYPSKTGYAGNVLDRIGPALFKGTAVLKAKQNATDPDSLVVSFTEPVREPLQNNTVYLNFFPQGQKPSLAAVKENTLQWVFVFASGSVKGNDSVNIVATSGIADTAGNKPHTANQRIPIIIQEGAYRIVDGAYCDANGDGSMDSLSVTFDRALDQAALAAMSFTFKWPDAANTVTTMTVKGADFTLSGGMYAAWRVTGYSIRPYVTSKEAAWGQATLTQPAISGGTTTADITLRDAMAPVIVSADYYAFNSPTLDDSLIVTFSENMSALGAEARPFKFWTPADPEYLVELREGSTANTRMTLHVQDFIDNIIPSAGDSIWIYAHHNVKDNLGNMQVVVGNKRQPLRVFAAFTVRAAAYLDTDARPDGYIDVIRVTLNAIPATFDFSSLAPAITLPSGRYFSPIGTGSFAATTAGFDIRVVQSKTNVPYSKVNTAVDANDKFTIGANTGIGGNNMILPVSIAISDSLAPVIIKGLFCPKLQNGTPGIPDTLIVTFSETVLVPGVQEPFKFHDISGAFPANYSMTLSPVNTTPDAIVTFLVDKTQKTYPQNGDSVWIVSKAQIQDNGLIVQSRDTKPAPLIVKPYPLIITITALNPISLSAPAIHPALVNRYGLGTDREGALITADISGHIEDPSRLSARLDILDAVGNIVAENITAHAVEYVVNNNKHLALALVWNLRNRNSRISGPAPYCAVISVKNGTSVIKKARIIIGIQE